MNTPSQADMSQGINPAFLSGGYGGGGANGAPQMPLDDQLERATCQRIHVHLSSRMGANLFHVFLSDRAHPFCRQLLVYHSLEFLRQCD